MRSLLQATMPHHAKLLEVVASLPCSDPVTEADPADPIFALQGQPRLVAIAQIDRDLALTLNRLIDQLVEGDFSEAAPTADELSHRIRTNYLASLSDAAGVTK